MNVSPESVGWPFAYSGRQSETSVIVSVPFTGRSGRSKVTTYDPSLPLTTPSAPLVLEPAFDPSGAHSSDAAEATGHIPSGR